MKYTIKITFILLSLIVSGEAFCSEIFTVDEMYKISKANVQTFMGKQFDDEISKITMSDKSFESGIRACMLNPKPHNLYGAYEFLNKDKAYKVYLKPESEFSNCISKLLENRDLPTPPKYPYYSPFEFNV